MLLESIPEGALSDALEDEIMGDSAQNHQVNERKIWAARPLSYSLGVRQALGTQSAETSVMGRPVVAGKQLWALPFFKTKLRAPVNNTSKEAATLPKKDNFVWYLDWRSEEEAIFHHTRITQNSLIACQLVRAQINKSVAAVKQGLDGAARIAI